MGTYIIRRLVYTIPIVFGVLLLTFILFTLVGGDISLEIAGKNATPKQLPKSATNTASTDPCFSHGTASSSGISKTPLPSISEGPSTANPLWTKF